MVLISELFNPWVSHKVKPALVESSPDAPRSRCSSTAVTSAQRGHGQVEKVAASGHKLTRGLSISYGIWDPWLDSLDFEEHYRVETS